MPILKKIDENETKEKKIASLANRPNAPSSFGSSRLTAEELKRHFDALPELLIERYNALINSLTDGTALDEIVYSADNEQYTLRELITGKLASTLSVKKSEASEAADLQSVLYSIDRAFSELSERVDNNKIIEIDDYVENDVRMLKITFNGREPIIMEFDEIFAGIDRLTLEKLNEKLNAKNASWNGESLTFTSQDIDETNLGEAKESHVSPTSIGVRRNYGLNANAEERIVNLTADGFEVSKTGGGYATSGTEISARWNFPNISGNLALMPAPTGLTQDNNPFRYQIPVLRSDGQWRYKTLSGDQWLQGQIPVRADGGALLVGAITDDNHASSKKYVDDAANALDERITFLEGGLLKTVVDKAEAYVKTVPNYSKPAALLSTVGGNSVRKPNLFDGARFIHLETLQECDGVMLDYFSVDDTLSRLTIHHGWQNEQTQRYTLTLPYWLPSGTYTIFGENANVESNYLLDVYFEGYTTTVTLTSGEFVNIVIEMPFDTTVNVDIMLNEGNTAAEYVEFSSSLESAPVTQLVSKDSEGNVLKTEEISAALRNACGEDYGKKYTYIDFDGKEFINEGYTFELTADTGVSYHSYGEHNGVHISGMSKLWTGGGICPHVSSEGTIAAYGKNSFWCGYGGAGAYWIGILDTLGYTTKGVTPTADKITTAISKFKNYMARRYNKGKPITIRQKVSGDDIVRTDISAHLTNYDDFKEIAVASGGSVTFENEKALPVPSTMTYTVMKEI